MYVYLTKVWMSTQLLAAKDHVSMLVLYALQTAPLHTVQVVEKVLECIGLSGS